MKKYPNNFWLHRAGSTDRCNNCLMVIEEGDMYLWDATDKNTFCVECGDDMIPGLLNDANKISEANGKR